MYGENGRKRKISMNLLYSKLITAFKLQIGLSSYEEGVEMGKYEKLVEAEKVWEGVDMCDCPSPICGCTPKKSEIAALRYALYAYWSKRIKPISKVMLPEFEKQYGKWTNRKSWRNFVMDVFRYNNLKVVEIIDAYGLNK